MNNMLQFGLMKISPNYVKDVDSNFAKPQLIMFQTPCIEEVNNWTFKGGTPHNCGEFLIAGTLCAGYTPATYRTRDGSAYYKFRYVDVGGKFQIDILSQPSYGCRDSSPHTTFRKLSARGGYRINIFEDQDFGTIEKAQEISMEWAELTQNYIKVGRFWSLRSLRNIRNIKGFFKEALNLGVDNETDYYPDYACGYDYYTDYNANTFLSIAALQQRIAKTQVNNELLNAAVFWFTNIERQRYGLGQFLFHNKLSQMAKLHSEQMKYHNFFEHDNPYNAIHRTLSDRLNAVKGNGFHGFTCCGENIADYPVIRANERYVVENRNGTPRLFSTNDGREIFPYTYYEFAKNVVNGWMNSPGHRANILNPEYKYLGCGCVSYKRSGSICATLYFKLTQNFGGSLLSWWR